MILHAAPGPGRGRATPGRRDAPQPPCWHKIKGPRLADVALNNSTSDPRACTGWRGTPRATGPQAKRSRGTITGLLRDRTAAHGGGPAVPSRATVPSDVDEASSREVHPYGVACPSSTRGGPSARVSSPCAHSSALVEPSPVNPPARVLIFVAFVSLIATVAVPLIQAVLSEDPPRSTLTCVDIASRYVDAMQSSPEMREMILPGRDGESVVLTDPEAEVCGVRPETLRWIPERSSGDIQTHQEP